MEYKTKWRRSQRQLDSEMAYIDNIRIFFIKMEKNHIKYN